MAASSLSNLLSSLLLLLPSKSPPPPPELSFQPRVPLHMTSRWAPLVANWAPSPSSLWDNVACPSLANSNVLFFSSGFNAQITVQDNESEEWLVNRFRREVIRSGVFRECKRRRFFENNQDKKRRMGTISKKKKKRKARQAARRNKNNNSQRSSRSKYRKQFKQQKLEKKDNEPKREEDNDSDDNWDFYEADLPYN
ncbi:hypothetical protein M0R45_023927 [Rubus argutus]|uniref:Uncharacterized protein n=1 Tax=Rubus argutus TaxID=59490 RepID=A0AAW1WSS2_RUBAR